MIAKYTVQIWICLEDRRALVFRPCNRTNQGQQECLLILPQNQISSVQVTAFPLGSKLSIADFKLKLPSSAAYHFILEWNRRSYGGGYQIKYVNELSRCSRRKRPAASTKTHSMLSKASLRSIFRHILGWPLFKWNTLPRSWDNITLSLMDLPGTKADWHGLISLAI